jgi:very-short-patch-repair endonuclease
MAKFIIKPPTCEHIMVHDELLRRGIKHVMEMTIEIAGVNCRVDIWIDPCLIVEIDGGWHREEPQLSKDRARDLQLEAMCEIRTLRFSNEEVNADLTKVVDTIEAELKAPWF